MKSKIPENKMRASRMIVSVRSEDFQISSKCLKFGLMIPTKEKSKICFVRQHVCVYSYKRFVASEANSLSDELNIRILFLYDTNFTFYFSF